jgi:hypothetical protein
VTYTYDESTITNLTIVRAAIGDTGPTNFDLTDELIDYYLGVYDQNTDLTIIDCLMALLAKYKTHVDRSGAQVQASRDQKTRHTQDLLIEYKTRVGRAAMPIFTGGVTKTAKDVDASDSDFIQPVSTVTGDNKPGVQNWPDPKST